MRSLIRVHCDSSVVSANAAPSWAAPMAVMRRSAPMGKHLSKTFDAPTELAMKVLGGKWKTIILLILQRHPCRYADFRQIIPNLSDKVLTDRLKALQAAGLITRERSAGTLYFLTPRGESLQAVLAELHDWGNLHASAMGIKIDQSQA